MELEGGQGGVSLDAALCIRCVNQRQLWKLFHIDHHFIFWVDESKKKKMFLKEYLTAENEWKWIRGRTFWIAHKVTSALASLFRPEVCVHLSYTNYGGGG